MMRSLAAKLTLAFLLVAITVAVLVAITIRLTSAGQLGRLIVEQQRSDFHAVLVTYYQANGSWDGVANQLYPQGEPTGPQSTPGPGGGPYGEGGHLLSKTLRHTPSGGSVWLSAAGNGDGVVLTVRDNGQGIPAEDVPFVFNRFYRVDKSRSADDSASGLGLAIVKALVDAHGGTITADSTAGAGSSFSIHLRADGANNPNGST